MIVVSLSRPPYERLDELAELEGLARGVAGEEPLDRAGLWRSEAMSDQADARDDTVAALNGVAEAAEATVCEQREVADTSRRLGRERERGASWVEIASGERARRLLNLLGMSARRVVESASTFRRALAVALAEGGLTTRQIAERFGVSHQRISSLLRREK
jgi:Homeodomain-like domain